MPSSVVAVNNASEIFDGYVRRDFGDGKGAVTGTRMAWQGQGRVGEEADSGSENYWYARTKTGDIRVSG